MLLTLNFDLSSKIHRFICVDNKNSLSKFYHTFGINILDRNTITVNKTTSITTS